MASIPQLPTSGLVNRMEGVDISRLFDPDSDAETEPADRSDTNSPQDGAQAQIPDDDGLLNFSVTARKGSSSNASPMVFRTPMDRTTHQSEAEVSDWGSAISEVPPATNRELRRLANFNNPGLRETTSYGPGARRRINYANVNENELRQEDEAADERELDESENENEDDSNQ